MQVLAFTLLSLAAVVAGSPALSTRQSDEDNAMLAAHNYYRRQHGAPDLVWDNNLAFNAVVHASQCRFEHTQNNPYGENLAASSGSDWPYQAAVDSWMSEAPNYNGYGFTPEAGHFTQGKYLATPFHSSLVWKSTQRLGCTRYTQCNQGQIFGDGSSNPATFVVCEYDPPGNYEGQFQQNVQ